MSESFTIKAEPVPELRAVSVNIHPPLKDIAVRGLCATLINRKGNVQSAECTRQDDAGTHIVVGSDNIYSVLGNVHFPGNQEAMSKNRDTALVVAELVSAAIGSRLEEVVDVTIVPPAHVPSP